MGRFLGYTAVLVAVMGFVFWADIALYIELLKMD